MSSILLRAGRPDDAVAVARIVYEAFHTISTHHNFPPDFPSVDVAHGLIADLLARKDVYSVIAERGGRVVGNNFLWVGDPVAGVGPITIDPSAQDSSIGRALMSDVLAHAEDMRFKSVRLVQAAYHNRSLSLYAKLGFDAREPLSTVQGPPLNLAVPGRNVRAAVLDDVRACQALGEQILGADRATEFRVAVTRGTASVVEHEGRITGYTTGIGFLGHAVGAANEDLQALIGAARSIEGPGMLLPTRNTELLRWCLANGLRVVQPMTLMSLGEYRDPRGAFLPSVLY
jgi:predicted N-acetyltransferase YhbS